MVDALTDGNQRKLVVLQLLVQLVAMSPLFLHSRTSSRTSSSGAWLIALGLAMLFAAPWFPVMPVVTAMAILALGATDATLARFRGTPAIVPDQCSYTPPLTSPLRSVPRRHAPRGQGRLPSGPGLVGGSLDLAASALPMAITLRRIVSCLRQQARAQAIIAPIGFIALLLKFRPAGFRPPSFDPGQS